MMMPNVIIAGAPKCATTSVFDWLSDHPDVCASNVKETYYFMDEGYPFFNKEANYNIHGIEKYGIYFNHCEQKKAKVILEATPDYLYQQTPLDVFPKLKPNPKIIFILRKPSDRVFSLYQFAKNNMAVLNKNISFGDFINLLQNNAEAFNDDFILRNAINHSKYVNYIAKWVEKLGQDTVQVFLFELLKKDSIKFMKDISEYIGIDGSFWDNYVFSRRNESYQIKAQWMQRIKLRFGRLLPEAARDSFLKKIYYLLNSGRLSPATPEEKKILRLLDMEFQPNNGALAQLLEIDLSVWDNERQK